MQFVRGHKAALVVALFPIAVATYAIGIAPRPAEIFATDIEPDFYYNGRLLAEGMAPAHTRHPGTPAQLFFAFLISIFGDTPDATDAVRTAAYVIIALANAGALFFFISRTAPRAPPYLQLLVGALIVSWPPFITHLSYAGSDSFLVAVALCAAGILWPALIGKRKISGGELVIAGAFAGLGIALKLTFLPFAVLLAIAASTNLLCIRAPYAAHFIFPFSAALAFLAGTFPIALEYPYLLKDTVFGYLSDIGGAFGVSLSFAISAETDIGVVLRYFTPLYIIAPLVLLWIVSRYAKQSFFQKRAAAYALIMPVLILPIFSAADFFKRRAIFIEHRQKHTEAVRAYLSEHAPAGSVVAYWNDNSPFAPPSAFHFWGNTRYARGYFDRELTRMFPTETLLNARASLTPQPAEKKELSPQNLFEKLRYRFRSYNKPPPPVTSTFLFMNGLETDASIFFILSTNSANDIDAHTRYSRLRETLSVYTKKDLRFSDVTIDGSTYMVATPAPAL